MKKLEEGATTGGIQRKLEEYGEAIKPYFEVATEGEKVGYIPLARWEEELKPALLDHLEVSDLSDVVVIVGTTEGDFLADYQYVQFQALKDGVGHVGSRSDLTMYDYFLTLDEEGLKEKVFKDDVFADIWDHLGKCWENRGKLVFFVDTPETMMDRAYASSTERFIFRKNVPTDCIVFCRDLVAGKKDIEENQRLLERRLSSMLKGGRVKIKEWEAQKEEAGEEEIKTLVRQLRCLLAPFVDRNVKFRVAHELRRSSQHFRRLTYRQERLAVTSGLSELELFLREGGMRQSALIGMKDLPLKLRELAHDTLMKHANPFVEIEGERRLLETVAEEIVAFDAVLPGMLPIELVELSQKLLMELIKIFESGSIENLGDRYAEGGPEWMKRLKARYAGIGANGKTALPK